jgi:hypothetical protein
MNRRLSIFDDHGDDSSAAFVSFVCFCLPYLALAWAYMELTDGRAGDFWIALGVLLTLRFFFFTIEALAGLVMWWLYGRRFAIRKMLAVLRTNEFPPRQPGERVYQYFHRIQRASDCPPWLRDLTQEFELEAAKFIGRGWIHRRRIASAMQEALERYETPVADSVAS